MNKILLIVLFTLLESVAVVQAQYLETLQLRGRIRDFSYQDTDFQEQHTGPKKGCIENVLSGQFRDIVASNQHSRCHIDSLASFANWYSRQHAQALLLDYSFVLEDEYDDGIERFVVDNNSFFPIDGLLGGNETIPGTNNPFSHNYNFTVELRFWFKYHANHANQKITVGGRDDIWVFVNNQLLIDIGGIRPSKTESIEANVLTGLGLADGELYPVDIFFAQRGAHEEGTGNAESHFYLQLQEIDVAPGIPELMIQDTYSACDAECASCTSPIARLKDGFPAYGELSLWERLNDPNYVNTVVSPLINYYKAVLNDMFPNNPLLFSRLEQACGHVIVHPNVGIVGGIPLQVAEDFCFTRLAGSLNFDLTTGGESGCSGSASSTFMPAAIINPRALRRTQGGGSGGFP